MFSFYDTFMNVVSNCRIRSSLIRLAERTSLATVRVTPDSVAAADMEVEVRVAWPSCVGS